MDGYKRSGFSLHSRIHELLTQRRKALAPANRALARAPSSPSKKQRLGFKVLGFFSLGIEETINLNSPKSWGHGGRKALEERVPGDRYPPKQNKTLRA